MDVSVSPRLATVLDQAIVAITGFSSMLLFAQTLPALDWAILSFAAGIALVSQGIQVNAVTIPMITFCRGQPIAYAEQQDWTWLNRAVLAAMLALSLVAGLVVLRIGPDWIGQSFLCAALLLPPAFSYEYLRRRLILLGDFRTLLYVSIAYAAGVAAGILLYRTGHGSPFLAALSFWPGMALSIAVSRLRDPLRFAAPGAAWFKPLLGFAPAAVGSSLAGTGYNFAVLAILGALTGPLAVAVFNATRLFVQPINTLVGAFNSLDIPRAATAYARGGKALIATQLRAIARLVAIGAPYLIVMCLLAEDLLVLVFGGRYKSESMVWSWCGVGLVMLLATPAEISFYVTNQTRLLFASKLVASVVACVLAYWTIPWLGAVAAVLSIAAGWTISFVGGAVTLWNTRADPAQPGATSP